MGRNPLCFHSFESYFLLKRVLETLSPFKQIEKLISSIRIEFGLYGLGGPSPN